MPAPQQAGQTPAYLYLRLSSADGPDSESNSIRNQRALLTRWAAENGFTVVREFADDGHTGTDFERPGFQALSASLLEGRVRCLIVKDLSRLGRNYTETGRYLEEIFPRLGVRFIAVNDGYDSADNTVGAAQMAVFKNVFNDWYAQEASVKVRASLAVLKKQGKFLGTNAPYGYRLDPEDRYHLLPDDRTAPVVREIYAAFLAGQSRGAIARRLTQEGVPTPARHCGQKDSRRRFTNVWNAETVRAILTHPVYRGDMAQQWTRAVSYKVHERRRVPPEQRIIVENTHQPLVSREEFALAQTMLQTRSYGVAEHPHLLTGVAYCADCGAPMYAKRRGQYWYLNCYGYYRDPARRRCTSHSIREDRVLAAVSQALQQAACDLDAGALARQRMDRAGRQAEEGSAAQLQRRLEQTKQALLDVYRDRAAGALSGEEAAFLLSSLRGEEEALRRSLERQQSAGEAGEEPLTARIRHFLRFEALNKAQLHRLVRRVEIDENKNIAIRFAFRDPAHPG